VGHEDQFPPLRLNARCWFGQETFAGFGATDETRRNRPLEAGREGKFDPIRTTAHRRLVAGTLKESLDGP
jgi:hypothetical protein